MINRRAYLAFTTELVKTSAHNSLIGGYEVFIKIGFWSFSGLAVGAVWYLATTNRSEASPFKFLTDTYIGPVYDNDYVGMPLAGLP